MLQPRPSFDILTKLGPYVLLKFVLFIDGFMQQYRPEKQFKIIQNQINLAMKPNNFGHHLDN